MLEKTLLKIALDLSLSLPQKTHYKRLISAINQVMPCDAIALLELDDKKMLAPVAIDGLSEQVLNMRFNPNEHPRLKAILSSQKPTRFEADSKLPDPYDGLLAKDPKRRLYVHDCMGCCLYVEEKLVGVLTLDALQVGAFRDIDDITIATIAALAAATMHNAKLISRLERQSEQSLHIANELVKEVRNAKGSNFIGESRNMLALKKEISVVAQSDLTVLITGETGVGKEVVARTVHAESLRKEQPLIQINCAALSENIIESELFGHVKGAFTGADKDRIGKFELANNATLFLDEVGELSLNAQAKLLRALQEGEIQRVGVDKNIYVDVRVIAATNRDLSKEVKEGRFREDLYHRLSVFPLIIPPLRDRTEDLPQLGQFILSSIQGDLKATNIAIDESAMLLFKQYDWPGNVREYQHVLMRAALRSVSEGNSINMIESKHLAGEFSPNVLSPSASKEQAPYSEAITYQLDSLENKSLTEMVNDFQRYVISKALASHNNTWTRAAKALHMDRANLNRLAKRLGMVSSKGK
ncbi:MAG: nitric oxide reductase transcriptional regulator NorR [Colwellia sp.]